MSKVSLSFDARNVTITSSNVNEVCVEVDDVEVDDIFQDIPYRDIAEYVSDNFNMIMSYIDSDMIVEYLKQNGYVIFEDNQI